MGWFSTLQYLLFLSGISVKTVCLSVCPVCSPFALHVYAMSFCGDEALISGFACQYVVSFSPSIVSVYLIILSVLIYPKLKWDALVRYMHAQVVPLSHQRHL